MDRNKCTATTVKKLRCRNNATANDELCDLHRRRSPWPSPMIYPPLILTAGEQLPSLQNLTRLMDYDFSTAADKVQIRKFMRLHRYLHETLPIGVSTDDVNKILVGEEPNPISCSLAPAQLYAHVLANPDTLILSLDNTETVLLQLTKQNPVTDFGIIRCARNSLKRLAKDPNASRSNHERFNRLLALCSLLETAWVSNIAQQPVTISISPAIVLLVESPAQINNLYNTIINHSTTSLTLDQVESIFCKVLVEQRVFGGTEVMRCTYMNLMRYSQQQDLPEAEDRRICRLMGMHAYLHTVCPRDYSIADWKRIMSD